MRRTVSGRTLRDGAWLFCMLCGIPFQYGIGSVNNSLFCFDCRRFHPFDVTNLKQWMARKIEGTFRRVEIPER